MILICLTNSCGKVKIIFYISLYITKFHYHNDTIVMLFRSETNNPNNCKMHYVDWSGNGQPPGHMLYDPFEEEAALLFGNHHHICPEMKKALQGVFLIAEQKKRIEESTKVSSTLLSSSCSSLGDHWSGKLVINAHPSILSLINYSKQEDVETQLLGFDILSALENHQSRATKFLKENLGFFFFRSLKTGNTLPWCWTDSFCGYSLWPS